MLASSAPTHILRARLGMFLGFQITLMILKHWINTGVSGDVNDSVPLRLFNQNSILPFAALLRLLLLSMHQ